MFVLGIILFVSVGIWMLTVAVARRWGASNTFSWISRCYQRTDRGCSATWLADSPVCHLMNLITESSCLILTRAWWVSWEDFLSTVTLLFDCSFVFGDPGRWGLPLVLGSSLSPVPMRRDWVELTAWDPLFAGSDSGLSWPAGLLMECACCFSLCAIAIIGMVAYWNWIFKLWYGYLQNCKLPQARRRRRILLYKE